MSDIGKAIGGNLFGSVGGGLFGAFGGLLEPNTPDLPKEPKRFLEEERKDAERSAQRRRTRARGNFGIADTALTGPQGLAQSSSFKGSAPTLGAG